jgi:mttA/Hcf106 family
MNVMSILLAFFGTWDLMIIAFISLLLFGNRLPSMMRSLGSGMDNVRCPDCDWWSMHPTRCLHCGRRKRNAFNTVDDLPRANSSVGNGQIRIDVPLWLIVLAVLSWAAWGADAIRGKWTSPDSPWCVWLHWSTLALVLISLVALTIVAVSSHFRDRI